jgi:hypothetical protein
MTGMRTVLMLLVLAAPAYAGGESKPAPKPELQRPESERKPTDGKAVCVYADRDQNAPSERGDCVADHDQVAQRPAEKTPPGGPGGDATPSAR